MGRIKEDVCIGEGIEEFFKNPPVGATVTNKTTSINSADVLRIKFSSWPERRKAAWRILTRGEVILRKKGNKK